MQKRVEDERLKRIEMITIDKLVPKNHLLRKVDKAIDFKQFYEILEPYYSKTMGRPCIDPVVLIKMVFIQHMYGINSLRRLISEIEVNIAYRWFLGFSFETKIPHFSTISYAFKNRFPEEVFEKIFTIILETAYRKGYIQEEVVFIDSTHIKANANKKKCYKEIAEVTAKSYAEELKKEINIDRENNGKEALKEDTKKKTKTVCKSTGSVNKSV